jgi:hypothetical protein
MAIPVTNCSEFRACKGARGETGLESCVSQGVIEGRIK